jgi:hypothetical protein
MRSKTSASHAEFWFEVLIGDLAYDSYYSAPEWSLRPSCGQVSDHLDEEVRIGGTP